jgi:tRNA(Ile2) C34 agmatinyltransferase TiaS
MDRNDSRHYHCSRCGASWEIPFTPSNELRNAVRSLIRSGSRMGAIGKLKAEGWDLVACKATVYHITDNAAKCHRCPGQLQPESDGDCPRCGALNLDW